jgi:hypothetical protein
LIQLTDEQLKETVETYEREGSISQAAKALGLARSSTRDRLAQAAARGIGQSFLGGSLQPGTTLAGTSTLYGPDGKARLQWVKARTEQHVTDVIQAIKDAFDKYKGVEPDYTPNYPKLEASRLVTVYPIADLHFGMYSWKEETGDDYDTSIASRLLTSAYYELLGRSIPSNLGIILNLGDFFHADNDEQKTRRSGNKMDVDTRYARVLREGVQLLIQVIEQAKQQHKLVLVKDIPGNHDPYGSLALTTALAARYSADDRVIVDTEADPIWHISFGKTMIVAAHGDMVKPRDLPKVAASRFSAEWGKTDWRYAYAGHKHRKELSKADGFESGGMEVEVFRTLAPKDAWNTQMGFHARRSLVGVTHDRDRGEIHRATVNVK